MFCRFLLISLAFLLASPLAALAADPPKEKPKETGSESEPAAEEPPVTIVSAVIDTIHNHNNPNTTIIVGTKVVHFDPYGQPVLNVTIRSKKGVAGLGFYGKWFDKSGKDITEDKIHKPTDPHFGFIWYNCTSTSSEDQILLDFNLPKDHQIETMKCSIASLYFRDKGRIEVKTPITFEAKKQPLSQQQGVKP